MIVSQSTTTGTVSSGADIVKMAEDIPNDTIVHLQDGEYNPEPEPEPDPGVWNDEGWD